MEERRKRHVSILQLEENVREFLNGCRTIFLDGIEELQDAAANIHDMHCDGRVGNVSAAVHELQEGLSDISEDPCTSPKAREKWKQEKISRRFMLELPRHYMRLCGTKEGLIISVTEVSPASHNTTCVTRQSQPLCLSPPEWR
ncbi:hypothetical protein LSM04_007472 [Trypanosoma melophagium]|uniref:uncharacterized protein n=1 Tax=Trypanosoma melophagium TaxID=715481 RepID=UPI00351A80AF|nr:hypothetical protein LSM04_007472 [Trypanosoma melophagium]